MSSASRSLARHRAAARTIAMLRLLARRVTSTPLASTSRISRLVTQQPCARAGASSAARPLARNAAAVARATSTIQQRASSSTTTTTANNNNHHHVNKCASSLTYDRASPYERTHLCGQVGREQHQRRVRLWGWVRSVRPSGKHLVFVTLRDYSGVVQLVVSDAALVDAAAELRSESVVWVEGVVQHRPTGALNEQLSTGAVEVRVSLLRLLSSVPSLPSEYTSLLQKDKTDAASLARPSTDAADATDAAADERLAVSVSDEARLRYRVLDLRRPHMQRNLRLRSRAAAAIRRIYDGTNSLTNSQPSRGPRCVFTLRATMAQRRASSRSRRRRCSARRPRARASSWCRAHARRARLTRCPRAHSSTSSFSWLAASIDTIKWLAAIETRRSELIDSPSSRRYDASHRIGLHRIALRASHSRVAHQQIDMEMSCIVPSDLFRIVERILRTLWKNERGIELPSPFPRMTYDEAMRRFGRDAPDLRFGMELTDLAHVFERTSVRSISDALAAGGSVLGINAKSVGTLSKPELEELQEVARNAGGKVRAPLARR